MNSQQPLVDLNFSCETPLGLPHFPSSLPQRNAGDGLIHTVVIECIDAEVIKSSVLLKVVVYWIRLT